MASQPSGQDQSADKNAYYILWMIALIAAVGGVIWYLFDYQLKQFFISVRIYEFTIIHFVLQALPVNLPWIQDTLQKGVGEAATDLALVQTLSPNTLSAEMAELVSSAAGEFLRYPVAVYLILLSVMVYKTNVHMRLKHKYNMKTLALSEQQNWPHIKIINKVDMLQEDIDSGPWAMAMTPMQFAKKNKLIHVEFADLSKTQFSKMQAPEYKVVLNRLRAERAFSVQLGRTWQNVENMPAHRRAIFAVFAARGCRDTQTALDLVEQLASSAASGKLDFTGADNLWKKHINNRLVKDICAHHAYEFTLLISMLQFAREDGVMASADFLWVKPLDRRLWYVINNVGRQTPVAEVAGIFCHWYTEMALKRPLSVPRVEAAVYALELALSDVIYQPDPEEKDELKKRQKEAANQEHHEPIADSAE